MAFQSSTNHPRHDSGSDRVAVCVSAFKVGGKSTGGNTEGTSAGGFARCHTKNLVGSGDRRFGADVKVCCASMLLILYFDARVSLVL